MVATGYRLQPPGCQVRPHHRRHVTRPGRHARRHRGTRDWQALHPHSSGGAYVNFLMDEGEDPVRAAYGQNFDRLVELKNKYDPTNLFRRNQNIPPTA
ncbi:MAG: BBE domain-containing protein [Caldilineaceae bacterium]